MIFAPFIALGLVAALLIWFWLVTRKRTATRRAEFRAAPRTGEGLLITPPSRRCLLCNAPLPGSPATSDEVVAALEARMVQDTAAISLVIGPAAQALQSRES